MQVNVIARQIKTEFGPLGDLSNRPVCVYPPELKADVVGYIIEKIEYFSFFSNELKDSAKEVLKTHNRFLAAKEALIISKKPNGREILNFLFNGKCLLSDSEIYKKFLAVEQEYKKAFENFKTKYYAWHEEYKVKPENNPSCFKKFFNWEAENRQSIPKDINDYLMYSHYDDTDHRWKMNRE